jgi:hypothetical protein
MSEEPPSPGSLPVRTEPPPPPVPTPRRALPLGRIDVGLLLVAAGILWLLEALDVSRVPWRVLLPVALIAIGLVLVAGSRTGRHGGLITVGAILTIVLLVVTSADIRLEGGVGQRTERPTTPAGVSSEYHLSLGQLEIDLRDVAFPNGSNTEVKATVGVGQLVVRVPSDVGLQIHATAGLGDLEVLGRTSSGGDVELNLDELGLAQAFVRLVLSVGVGQVTVTR